MIISKLNPPPTQILVTHNSLLTNHDQYPPTDQELIEEEIELFDANQLELALSQNSEFLYRLHIQQIIAATLVIL